MSTLRDYVTFRVAEQTLGIPVDQVQEILTNAALTAVPKSPASVMGLMNLRGQIVTILDVRKRLGIADREQGSPFMNIVVEGPGELFGLLVDSVGDVISVDEEKRSPPPALLGETWRQACSGVFALPGGLLVTLDIQAVLKPEKP